MEKAKFEFLVRQSIDDRIQHCIQANKLHQKSTEWSHSLDGDKVVDIYAELGLILVDLQKK